MDEVTGDAGDDAELAALEADVAVIEAAMEQVDAGDLDGFDTTAADLGRDRRSEQVGDGTVGDEVDPGAEGQPTV